MFERFTDRARRVTVLAQEEARMMVHNYLGVEHFLLAFVAEQEGVAAKALADVGVAHLPGLRGSVEGEVGLGPEAPSGHIPFTPQAKKMLEQSLREALQLGHNYIGTEHMLLATCRILDADLSQPTARVLLTLGVTPSEIRQAVISRLSSYRPAGADTGARAVPPAAKVLDQTPKNEGILVDQEELVKACEEYLADLHCALWGQAFDMFQKDSRRSAADFLAEAMLGVVQHMEAKEK